MARCLTILVGVLFVFVAFAGLFSARITPSPGPGPGGLQMIDYVGIGCLPIGAFAAGRHWYRHELFLLYGGAGMLLFIPAFLSDGNYYYAYYVDPYADTLDAMLHDAAAWTIAVVAMGVTCMFAGRWGHRRFRVRRN